MRADAAREEVLAICRALSGRGFLAGTGGNVALQIDDAHFAVTPSATDYYAMSPDDICVLRLRDLQQVEGRSRPSVESGLHARLLRTRPECVASVHTHQPLASAYTLLGRPLEMVSAEHREVLGDTVPCAGYAPSGTRWLTSKVARALPPGGHACLMRNHGVVCLGESTAMAVRRVEVLEDACAAFFGEATTRRRDALPPAVVARLLESLKPRLSPDPAFRRPSP